MKLHLWDFTVGKKGRRSSGRPRRRSVAAILRDAYRCHAIDRHTRLAVKRWLR